MHTVFALLCFVVVIHWLIFPYPSGLLHWHCGNLMIAPVPAKQPWWIWINTSCEFIMNDCITTTKQSTTKPCAHFLGYTVWTPCCFITAWMSHLTPEFQPWFGFRSSRYTSPCVVPHAHGINLLHILIGETQRHCSKHHGTVETLYSTIYNSKYFIELNFDKSTQYVNLWTHKRHPIPRPFGRAMECLLWVFQQKLTVL